jgi:Ca2+-binding EF-hand superfamily protein
MSNQFDVRVDETVHRNGDRIVEVNYVYQETRNSDVREYRVAVKRQDYERMTGKMNKPALSFDSFAKVLRPFMMGQHASEDIPEAFRLLDTDHSGTIDIGELAAFMPVIVPDANPYMLLHHVQKADKNNDYKLNLEEFTALINQGVGRDIALGRL